jgi:mycothiol synthase
VELTWLSELPDDTRVRELLLAAMAEDGRPEITRDEPLPREFRGGRHLLATEENTAESTLVAYAHLDPAGDAFGNQVVELIVHPAHRRAGVGGAVADEVLTRTDGPLRFWSHGDHPAAARLAERRGLAKVRELLKMRLGGSTDLPEPTWPPGVRVRTFEPGRDERAMIEVNARAFDWHPEQGRLTVEELLATEAESWFDPAGFFLAVDADDTLLGYHWTKVHPGEPPVGEVYVVGVDPSAQGGGLGKALTLVGLHHLRKAGLGEIILYVESDNSPAVAVYTRLGFTRWESDVAYQR